MTATLIDQFVQRFEAIRGHCRVVNDFASAADAAVDICIEAEATRAAIALVDDGFIEDVASRCAARGISLLRPPFPHAELPAYLDSVQVGITGAAFGIAQTGTLAEVCTDDSHRLVSALPRTYIGIVRASTLVEIFFQASPRLREIFASHPTNCTVSFISGPSRTGDIEMILTLGVHGPESANAIIVDDIGGGRG